MINFKDKSDKQRQQYRVEIRRQHREELLKQKRKQLMKKSNSLEQLHHLLSTRNDLAVNKHFLQTLIDSLSDQVFPQEIKYLDLFMQMAISHNNHQIDLLTIIGLVCFEKQDTQPYVSQICNIILNNMHKYRQKCLWLLANLSSSSQQSVIDLIIESPVNQTLQILVQQQPLNDQQKISIVKYYMNMTMGRPNHMLKHISILQCMNQSSNVEIIRPCCHSLIILLDICQDHVIMDYVLMILRYCLIHQIQLSHVNLMIKSVSNIAQLIDHGIWQFIWSALTHKSLIIRKKGIELLDQTIAYMSDDMLNGVNLTMMVKCLVKQFYQDSELEMPVLKLLQNAVERSIFVDVLLEEQQWRTILAEYQISNSEMQAALRFLDVLLKMAREIRQRVELKEYVERICEDCVMNQEMLAYSQRIMARLR